jgi:hypothetical protein
MLCFSHGGYEECEKINKQYNFVCPMCAKRHEKKLNAI